MSYRVLLATDGSAGADTARELLTGSFRPTDVDVDVVHVIPTPLGLAPGTMSAEAVVIDGLREAADAAISRAAEAVREAGFNVTAETAMGHPAAEIVRLAEVEHPDLVLVGTRGLSGLKRALAGSVAEAVARHAPTSVLMAHGPTRLGHVLVGVDGSPNADACLRLLERLPFVERPRVTVATSYDVPRPLHSGIAPGLLSAAEAAYTDDLAAAERWAAETAQRAASSLAGSWPAVEARTARGPARDALATLAHEIEADLVIVGCRGLSSVKRFLLGSTSAGLVAHPPTSVLVVHDPHP